MRKLPFFAMLNEKHMSFLDMNKVQREGKAVRLDLPGQERFIMGNATEGKNS